MPRGGLSELSVQLRKLQATNQAHTAEIERLHRQIRILGDLKGVSISDLMAALGKACEEEAHEELQSQVSLLRARLNVAVLVNNAIGRDGVSFDKESSDKKTATLQLGIAELEERENILRAEMTGLYKSLKEQTSKATRLDVTCAQQKDQIETLKEEFKKENGKIDRQYEQMKSLMGELDKERERAKADKEKPAQLLLKADPENFTNNAEIERLNEHVRYVEMQQQAEIQRGKAKNSKIEQLTERAHTAEIQLKVEMDNAKVLENELDKREKEALLRTDQFKSRFNLQDERITDLEQQVRLFSWIATDVAKACPRTEAFVFYHDHQDTLLSNISDFS